MGQILDESHRVGDDDVVIVRQMQFAHGGIQGREQLIRLIHAGAAKPVEQGGFAGIGVTHQRHGMHRHFFARLATQLTAFCHFIQPFFQAFDASANQAPVGFQLGFARAAQADTAFLTLQVSPAAHQPRGNILQLGKLHLQLAFVGVGAAGKNIQYQPGAVDNTGLQRPFEVSFLHWRNGGVDHHQLGPVVFHRCCYLLDLAGTEKSGGMWTGDIGKHDFRHFGAGGNSEQADFLRTGIVRFAAIKPDMNNNRLFWRKLWLDHQAQKPAWNSVILAFGRNTHNARRHHGGDGVLVDHLTDRVLEQDDKLVE